MGNIKSYRLAIPAFLLTAIIIQTAASQTWNVPELIYYKFRNNIGTSTPNYASSPVGNNPAVLSGVSLAPGGQFDTCMMGSGSSGTNGVNTGWNCNLGANRWTISFWVKNLAETSPGIATYIFGDPGSSGFRCFYGGAATPNNILLRGPMTDIVIPCQMPGEFVFHFVYNGTSVKVYRNGVFLSTVDVTLNMGSGTGFRAGGYTGGTYSLNANARLDEFRVYNRALSSEEIAATWNIELPWGPTGISGNTNVPDKFVLNQNYPNPFNPSTVITYSLPAGANVKLSIIDMLGKEIAVLVNGYENGGSHSVSFDASGVSSGIYLYRLSAGNDKQLYNETKRMVLIK